MQTLFVTLLKVLASLLILSMATMVKAEGILIKSEPKDKTEVSHFNREIKLWFSGNVSERTPSVVVVDNQGKRVDNHDTHLVIGERSRLTASTAALTSGLYAVRYRVVTVDGLVVSGIQHFTVKN